MKFFAYLSVAALRTFSDGWAIWMLWGWFVEPLGAPAISYWHAVGLDLFVGLFFAFAAPKPTDDDDQVLGWAAGKLALAPIYVGIGWLITLGLA